jgi:ligand-binding sensor domain-containing protein
MKVESSYLPEVNSLEEFDYWIGFQQTKDGKYYLASSDYGLWEMTILSKGNPSQKGTKVKGLPTDALTSVASTDDGSLFIGTSGSGLWRMDAQKQLQRVADVPGSRVKQVIYDSSATPGMLYVLTDSGLTVLRGY